MHLPAPNPLRISLFLLRATALGLFSILIGSCAAPQVRSPDVTIILIVDNTSRELSISPGTTVANALAQAGVTLGPLDQVTPPLYSLLADGTTVRVVRIQESFEVEQVAIPYDRQIVRNEALPAGETRTVQAGKNGLQEITYRVLTEDGVVTSRTPLRTVVITEPVPEILMIGSSSTFGTVSLRGVLVYIDSGNAWIMTQDSDNRFPLAASGDLDSRVFSLSPDGQWLLLSRKHDAKINSLFVTATSGNDQPFPLSIYSIIHFADWSPAEKHTIAYSTVEPASVAPGWQARNDLRLISFDEKKTLSPEQILIAPNSAGSYPWWGLTYAWSPDGTRLAYASADEIGWISREDGSRHPMLSFAPFRTQSDWVWLPSIHWSPDGAFLLTVRHGNPVGQELPEESPVFDLVALSPVGGEPIRLFGRTGMFAYPVAGPIQNLVYEQRYNVAFLQAIRPLESDRSKYRLMVSDRDGSNERAVFPAEGETGLSPREAGEAKWSPDGTQIALIYNGNLWIIDVSSGSGQQLTGDGQVTAIDWK